MAKIFCFISLFFFMFNAFSQTEVIRLPVQFSQYQNDFSAINPAMLSLHQQYELSAGTQFNAGTWGGIYTYYAGANFQLNAGDLSGQRNRRRPRPKPKQVLGGFFYGDREGELLSRQRGYAKYAVHIPIERNLNLGAGAAVGFMSYAVNATPISGGGNAATIDADIGLSAFGEDWHVGISFHQIPRGSVRPIEETTILARYINYTALKDIELSRDFKLRTFTLFRWVPSFNENTFFDIDVIGVLAEKASLGLGYRQKRGWTTMLSLEQIPLDKGIFKVVFAYNLSARGGFTNINTFEVALKYLVKN